jgi:membrane protease YdiL (CAAX protease family)
MIPFAVSVAFVVIVWLAIVILNETKGLLSCDHFPTPAAKYVAYLLLGVLMLMLAVMITGSALAPATLKQLNRAPFYSLFTLHFILLAFLLGWWLLTGRPNLLEFLNVRHEKPVEVAAIGLSVGVAGWVITIIFAIVISLILRATGVLEEPAEPPAAIVWMAALPIWKKAVIVFTAMTVEEMFFRSFLQKRIGLIASTILFALAHFSYGNPLLLIGVFVISTIIGLAFYRTKNVLPGVIAHGVFDAIQLFVLVPIAFKLMGAGA